MFSLLNTYSWLIVSEATNYCQIIWKKIYTNNFCIAYLKINIITTAADNKRATNFQYIHSSLILDSELG